LQLERFASPTGGTDVDITETGRMEAVALGRTWADERAARLRQHVPAEQWPDSWDDADDGPLPADADPSAQLRLRMLASNAAHQRWRELVAQQRASEALERGQQTLEVQSWPRARDMRGRSRSD
jgi:hypothetical protein